MMMRISPLRKLQEQAEADFVRFGPAPGPGEAAEANVDDRGVELVGTFGEIEAEYAAIRKAAALIDLPHRGTLRITGGDRREFLNNLLTNDIKGLSPGRSIRAFWLNRQGRIQADLRLVELGEYMLVDLDYAVAASTVNSLNDFIFAEDAMIEDVSSSWSRIALHGPGAIELLQRVRGEERSGSLSDLQPDHAVKITIGAAEVVALRADTTGEPGLEIFCPMDHTLEAHERILEAGLGNGLRMIGWYAYNMARIEGGRPLFLVDFGPDSLPHETGVLHDAVSFTKGCYLGQEVVARMENLGHPKKRLVGLRVTGEKMPVTGAPVVEAPDRPGDVIGAVTSSSPSPMLGAAIVGFAMVKYDKSKPGTQVAVSAEGELAAAEVTDLTFWRRS